eukprot:510673_1
MAPYVDITHRLEPYYDNPEQHTRSLYWVRQNFANSRTAATSPYAPQPKRNRYLSNSAELKQNETSYSHLPIVCGVVDRTPPMTKSKNYALNYDCDTCRSKVGSKGQMCMYCNNYGAHQNEMIITAKGRNIIVCPNCATTTLSFKPTEHPYIDPVQDASINNIVTDFNRSKTIYYMEYVTYDEHIVLGGRARRPIIHRYQAYTPEEAQQFFGVRFYAMLGSYHSNKVLGLHWMKSDLSVDDKKIEMLHANNNGLKGGLLYWGHVETLLSHDWNEITMDFITRNFYPEIQENDDNKNNSVVSDSEDHKDHSIAYAIIKDTPKRSILTIESEFMKKYPISLYVTPNTIMLSQYPYKTRKMFRDVYLSQDYKHLNIIDKNDSKYKDIINDCNKKQYIWLYKGDWTLNSDPKDEGMKRLCFQIMSVISKLNVATSKTLPDIYGWLSQYVDAGILNGTENKDIIDFLLYTYLADNPSHRDSLAFYKSVKGMVPVYYTVTLWSTDKVLCPHYLRHQCKSLPYEHLKMEAVSIGVFGDHGAINGEYHGIHTDKKWWQCKCVNDCRARCKNGKWSTKMLFPAFQIQFRPSINLDLLEINVKWFL